MYKKYWLKIRQRKIFVFNWSLIKKEDNNLAQNNYKFEKRKRELEKKKKKEEKKQRKLDKSHEPAEENPDQSPEENPRDSSDWD